MYSKGRKETFAEGNTSYRYVFTEMSGHQKVCYQT